MPARDPAAQKSPNTKRTYQRPAGTDTGTGTGTGKPRAGTTPAIVDGRETGVQWLTIGETAAGQRVDNFLLNQLRGVPRSLVYRILRSGEVRVNKGRVKPTQRLAPGDLVRIPPLRLTPPAAPPIVSASLGARLEAGVLFEDRRLLVLDKPAGVAVHGGSGINLGVIEALRVLRPQAELELVHRLDRDTSGCLLISKRGSALRHLHAQFRDGDIDKRYLVLLVGRLPRNLVEVTAPLRKNQLQGGERMVQVDPDAGKPARTRFRVLQRLRLPGSRQRPESTPEFTLAEVALYTGRTHQIRVHAAHLGLPVAGDDKYGDAEANAALRQIGLKRLFLHASSLAVQPAPEQAPLRVAAPLPAALTAILNRLGASIDALSANLQCGAVQPGASPSTGAATGTAAEDPPAPADP